MFYTYIRYTLVTYAISYVFIHNYIHDVDSSLTTVHRFCSLLKRNYCKKFVLIVISMCILLKQKKYIYYYNKENSFVRCNNKIGGLTLLNLTHVEVVTE